MSKGGREFYLAEVAAGWFADHGSTSRYIAILLSEASKWSRSRSWVFSEEGYGQRVLTYRMITALLQLP